MEQNKGVKRLVDEKTTRHDSNQENSLPPLRGRVGVGGNSQHKPRPCGCNTRELVNNRFPALKGWGLRGGNPQSLINDKHLARASRGRALSAKMTKSLQTTSADPFNASEQDFAYSPIHLFASRKRFAFTLAEVLITLAVIGIVAVMTIPNLVQSYKKKVVETRLVQFYSMMNQAVRLSEIDYGEQTSWVTQNGNALVSYSIEKYFNKYFAPHLKYSKLDIINDSTIAVYFANGSAMTMTNQDTVHSPHIYFYPFGQIKDDSVTGKDRFIFAQSIALWALGTVLYTKGIQPYSWRQEGWDGLSNEDIDKILREDSVRGCNNLQNDKGYCGALIMRNGWKIPDDYPFKF